MGVQPIPIQVISLFSADGSLQPVRFRFEDEQHQLHTVRISRIVDVREVTFVGMEAFRFLCLSEEEDCAHLFELDYTVRTHRWRLRGKVY